MKSNWDFKGFRCFMYQVRRFAQTSRGFARQIARTYSIRFQVGLWVLIEVVPSSRNYPEILVVGLYDFGRLARQTRIVISVNMQFHGNSCLVISYFL